jgi:hypothetical protein
LAEIIIQKALFANFAVFVISAARIFGGSEK